MKCIADKACQARLEDSKKIKTFAQGDTWDFEECPPNFTSLESGEVVEFNLDKMSEEQIIEAEVDREILISAAADEYDKNISRYKRYDSLVKAFCDARFRYVDQEQLKDMR